MTQNSNLSESTLSITLYCNKNEDIFTTMSWQAVQLDVGVQKLTGYTTTGYICTKCIGSTRRDTKYSRMFV